MKKIYLSIVLLFGFATQAQLIIDNTTQTPAQLVQNALVGQGVIPTNIKFNGSAANALLVRDQVAKFSTNFNPTNLGLDTGLVLATGNATVALGPNNAANKSIVTATPTAGDADLALLSGQSIQNVAVVEFDFVATGPTLHFDFVFASEEYPEYVNSINDSFGFFLSGPGIAGSFSGGAANIAIVPSTTTPISINTVNNGHNNSGTCTNCAYYYNNSAIGVNPTAWNPAYTTQYDGFTRDLSASATLICGQTYHIKLAIGNASDNLWDSAVFLKNFSIPPMVLTDISGATSVIGCEGPTVIYSGVAAGTNTFVWTFNGVLIPTATAPNLTITANGTYELSVYNAAGCLIAKDDIIVNFAVVSSLDPQNITICATGSGPYTFNINQNAYMLNGAPVGDYIFTYHVGSATGPVISPASLAAYSSAGAGEQIWVVSEDQNVNGCLKERFFTLNATTSPSGTFSYANSTYCNSITSTQPVIPVGLTPSGIYTSTPVGLTLDSGTGAITPSTSTTGITYTVHYDIAASATCPAYHASTTVTINPVLTPTINCGASTTSTVEFTWAAVSGATDYIVSYQIGANPVVNVGAIGNVLTYTVTGLTPGDTVVITLTPTGGVGTCFSANTQSCIATNCNPPTATIGYGTPFCNSTAVAQNVTLTGTGVFAGGSYSATAGLSINGTTGAITPSTSTAGTYTVTYTIAPAAPGCSSVTATTTVVINEQPNAGVDGTTSACDSDTTPIVLASLIAGEQAGGTWTQITGTGGTFNAVAGTYTPALGATTSTFAYTLVGAAPCSNDVSLATVTINPAPVAPTIATQTPATCTTDATSVVTNYNATFNYTFTPSGPSVGAGGVLTGMTAGTSYTVTAGNGSCTSVASAPFSNAVMLATPAVPTINPTVPTCTSNGATTISNYNAALLYTFTPSGPSVGAGGLVTGMTLATNYTVTAGNGSCASAASASFSNAAMLTTPAVPIITIQTPATCTADATSVVTNYNATFNYTFIPSGPSVSAGGVLTGMTAGTSYTVTAGNGSCTSVASAPFINAVMLVTPVVPTINPTLPTCTSNGATTISNYNAALLYTFTPSGPSVGAGGLVTGMTLATSYTVTASNGSCASAGSASFSNAAMLTTPAVPIITIQTPATCTADATSVVANYNAAFNYTFTPSGPSVGAGGVLTGMTAGASYTVTAGNGSCTSVASAPFINAVMLVTPVVPTINPTPPTCTSNGATTISNYNAALLYTFTPSGPSVGAGGLVTGMTLATSYTVTASNGSCASAGSASFSNAAMLTTPAVPIITIQTPATCTADATSVVANYNAAFNYTFTPSGPSVGAGGVLTGMTAGTSYTVTAGNGSCTSVASAPFINAVMLVTPVVPTINPTPPTCTSNGATTISNYNAALLYTFTPSGPSVGAGGLVTGMTLATSYTVTASNGSCASAGSASFSNATMLATPILVITNPTAVCSSSTVDITDVAVTTGSTAGGTYTYWTDAAATNALTAPNAVTANGTYYIKLTVNGCSVIQPVVVKINAKPNPILNSGTICLDAAGNPISTHMIDTQLSDLDYTFVWSNSAGVISGATQSSYLATVPGTYSVIATSLTTPPCNSGPVPVTIDSSSPPSSISLTTSSYFADNLTITVNATPASSNYEYQLDNGNFQDSTIFTSVPSGTHVVTVRDKKHCGFISREVTLVDYPRFFTPNGDGYHDTWNISFLKNQLNSKIEVFDRFGKLLKIIQPSGIGWNGTFSGQQLPATDYWFVVYYEEDTVSKTFRSHFALKR